jgi:O-antigen ligase
LILFSTILPFVRRIIRTLAIWRASGAALFLVLDAVMGLRQKVSGGILASLNRDPTLTGRTDAWKMLIAEVDNPLLGEGYNSFWSGERLRRMWEHYEIIQAHSGYVETYLNGGICALLLLCAFLIASTRRLYKELLRQTEYARIRFAFLVIAITHNYTEASFNKMSLLWFVCLLVVMDYRDPRRINSPEGAFRTSPLTTKLKTHIHDRFACWGSTVSLQSA